MQLAASGLRSELRSSEMREGTFGFRLPDLVARAQWGPKWHCQQMKRVHAAIVLESLKADAHLVMLHRGRRAIGAEQTVPPREQKSEVRVLFLILVGMVDAMQVRSNQKITERCFDPSRKLYVAVGKEILQGSGEAHHYHRDGRRSYQCDRRQRDDLDQ